MIKTISSINSIDQRINNLENIVYDAIANGGSDSNTNNGSAIFEFMFGDLTVDSIYEYLATKIQNPDIRMIVDAGPVLNFIIDWNKYDVLMYFGNSSTLGISNLPASAVLAGSYKYLPRNSNFYSSYGVEDAINDKEQIRIVGTCDAFEFWFASGEIRFQIYQKLTGCSMFFIYITPK